MQDSVLAGVIQGTKGGTQLAGGRKNAQLLLQNNLSPVLNNRENITFFSGS